MSGIQFEIEDHYILKCEICVSDIGESNVYPNCNYRDDSLMNSSVIYK